MVKNYDLVYFTLFLVVISILLFDGIQCDAFCNSVYCSGSGYCCGPQSTQCCYLSDSSWWPIYLTIGLVPFIFVSILICILARRRVLKRRLNNMRFPQRNPQVFVSPVVLYPNQIYPSHSESNISQLPPSYETVKKTFILPSSSPPPSFSLTTSVTRENGPSNSTDNHQQMNAKQNEVNNLENQI